ncbi:MAG TPA: RidA family protein [Vicinamibacterales bacterium]|nr:RidA family protein [Vicinamibacterales bacterium]
MQERRVISLPGPDGTPVTAAVAAGGLIFVSAQGPIGADGKPVESDISAQTKAVIARLGKVLEASGSSLAQAVSVNVFLRQSSDFEAMNAAYRETFAEKPPVRTTVAVSLPGRASVMMSAIAVPNGAPREVMHPAGWMKSPRPYSYIVRAAGFVFLSGLVSRRGTDDQVVPGPASVQTSTVLDNAGILLKTAGLTYADVVSARVFLVDDTYFEAMNDEYRRYFTTEPPARATAITGLMGPDATVEISFIAAENGKQVIGPAVAPSLPLSTAVRANDLLFLSGVLGNTDANAGDVAGQAGEIFNRIGRTLEGMGLSFNHVVDNLVYLPDVWQLPKFEARAKEIFSRDTPARTVVGARLATRAGLIEMMMTAAGH